jgi:hypothetical protein
MTDPVQAYLDALEQPWQKDLARALHATVIDALPDAVQRIQYSKPHYLKGKAYLAVISVAKAFVSFTIFNAGGLTPPAGVFERSENGDRITVKLKQGQSVDAALLGGLLREAASTL